ncbi:MAG: hypothetical protein LUO91_04655 [Methanomicrobiales archaeon]|nr:hypothetical protein [Methanomicrobiales archaeon]
MTRLSRASAGIILAVLALLLLPSPSFGAIRMEPEYRAGEVITLAGTTNLASGNQLWIEIISASFAPAQKGEDTTFSGSSGIVTVDRGTWTYTFSTAGFRQDEYLVTVEAVGIGVIDKGSFRLMERPLTTPVTTVSSVTGTATAPVTGSPTVTPKAGGFAGLLALPVLLIVLLRRRT